MIINDKFLKIVKRHNMITADKFLEIVNRYNNFDVHFTGKNIIVNYLRNVSKSYLDGNYIDIAKFMEQMTCVPEIELSYGQHAF